MQPVLTKNPDTIPAHSPQRTIYSTEGKYRVTFLETAEETQGEYLLVSVTMEPGGGNDWHLHRHLSEKFEVVSGRLGIGYDYEEILLEPGQSLTAQPGIFHKFYNPASEPVTFLVTITPPYRFAEGLRIGYGLVRDGKVTPSGIPKNPLHLALLMQYTDTYIAQIPVWVQKLLLSSLLFLARMFKTRQSLEKYLKD
jgi:mannose-6-phosphate isomerase-like protein (cupin superfamily)